MPPLLASALTGLAAGAHSSIWGMYKDAPHEGFSLRVFTRSMVFGTLVALLIARVTGLVPVDAASFVLFFGLVYVVERAVAEAYKTFFRQQDQSKYTIPMQFAVLGRPVEHRGLRMLLGVAYVGIMVLTLGLILMLQRAIGGPAPLWVVFLVGGAAGWISAFGGAWKDAPIEGFQILKFFRSPFMAGVYALLVSLLTDDLVFITMAAEGFVIMTTETYKTFFFPSKPRGKFANKPVVFPEWLQLRQRFVPFYLLIWLAVIGAYGVAVASGQKVPVTLWERASD
jgi:hypothetical protein